MSQSVKFWFDATCPFAWATSRWVKEVEKVRDITVEFVPMSLAVLNDVRDLPEEYTNMMQAAWGPARVFAKVATEEPTMVSDLYTIMGNKVHGEEQGGKTGYGAYDELIKDALAEAGLDASYAEVANTEDADEALRAFHNEAINSVGDEVGTPVIKLGDTAFFGPVITRIPTGEEAGEIFDAAVRLSEYPYFFEIKRSRTEMPQVSNKNK